MSVLHMDARKWPDRRHWQYPMRGLGEDDHGAWLHVPAETEARRGDEPPRPLPFGFVALIPRGGWWTAEFYRDHPHYAVYVNIGTPSTWDGDRVVLVDLDLDVVRRPDGTVDILDEDEFLAHQVELSYPRRLVEGARAAAAAAVEILERRIEPFGAAADPWLDLAMPRG